MDIDRTIAEMEQAATILMNPFQATSRDHLKQSENVFLNFSKAQITIPDLFSIMTKTRNELLLFETVKLIKNIIIYEWRGLNDEDKLLLRQKLLDFVLNDEALHASVVERILQIVAIMIKRKFLEDGGEQLKEMIEGIKGMIFSPNQTQRMQQVASMILVSILQEFTNTVKSEDVVLSFEEHFRCKKMFETRELPVIFKMILDALEQLLPMLDMTNNSHMVMIESSVKTMELILSWSYITALIPKRIIKAFENLNNIKQQPSLRLSVIWQPLMFRSKTIEVFFIIYWRVRDHKNLQQRAMNCLIQMATLSGPIFQQPDSSFNYFKEYVSLFLTMAKLIECDEREAFGIATIIRKLLCLHNVKTEFVKLDENIAKEFLGAILMFTVKYIENQAAENSSYGDNIYTDASKNLLEAWLDLINLADTDYADEIRNQSRIIFNKFVGCHLNGAGNSNEEINDIEESERESYKEQLIIIGFLGRMDIEMTLLHLSEMLELKLGQLCNAMNDPNEAVRVFDAISWIMMVGNNVLCMDAVGEKPLIPREINHLCQKLQSEGKIDSQSSLAFLQSSTNLEGVSVDPSKCDPALRFFAGVLRLCEMENRAIEKGFGAIWSPLISSTIVWFIGNFINSYLYIDASYYFPLAPLYTDLLVHSAPNGVSNWCMDYILRKIAFNMHKYYHEVEVVEESIKLFLDIVNVRNQKISFILDLPSFQNLIHMRDVQLDSKVKRSVYKGLVMATAAFTNIEQRQECLRHLLEPIGKNFDALLVEGQRNPHDTAVREQVLIAMDELTGVAQGINGQTFSFVYQLMCERFRRLTDMMSLWKNYLDIQCAILKVLIEMATVQMTSTNAAEMAKNFYSVSLLAIITYMEQQTSRLEKIYNEDEEQPDDVLLVVELFKKLTIQYIFEPAEPTVITSLGAVILSNLMPKMYPIIERYPDIAMAYYKGLNCFLELLVCNNQLHNLPIDLINHFLYTIKIGLTSFSYPEIQGHSLDLLGTMGDAILQDTDQHLTTLKNLLIEPFGKLLFDVIVSLDLHSENKNDCFSAIFILGCASHDPSSNFCHESIRALVNRQKSRLTYAGATDAPEVEVLLSFTFRQSREQKLSFIDLFDKFVSSICFLYHN